METEDAIDLIPLEHAAFAHAFGTAGRFLGRLEHKQHVARQRSRAITHKGIDPYCRSKYHGHMSVMSTSVHASLVLRRKRDAGRLSYGQCIHVGANRHGVGVPHIEQSADATRTRREHLAR